MCQEALTTVKIQFEFGLHWYSFIHSIKWYRIIFKIFFSIRKKFCKCFFRVYLEKKMKKKISLWKTKNMRALSCDILPWERVLNEVFHDTWTLFAFVWLFTIKSNFHREKIFHTRCYSLKIFSLKIIEKLRERFIVNNLIVRIMYGMLIESVQHFVQVRMTWKLLKIMWSVEIYVLQHQRKRG